MFSRNPSKLGVFFLSAESLPFVKIGGLGDYAGSLPQAINNLAAASRIQVDVRVALPFHDHLELPEGGLKKICDISVPKVSGAAKGSVYEISFNQIRYYLIRRKGNASGYQSVYNTDPLDDARKFIFFSLASMRLLKQINWQADIIHANDWHTSIAVKETARLRKTDEFYQEMESVIVIHNLPFFGEGAQPIMREYGIEEAKSPTLPKWARNLPFPVGLEAADQIVAVSPSYAEEVLQEEFGHGLQNFFHANQHRITGILNGIDSQLWNPANDQLIHANFSPKDLSNRILNKQEIINRTWPGKSIEEPLLILISRLTYQKGIDLILTGLPEILNESWSAIFLGRGQSEYEQGFKTLEKKYSHRIKYFSEYNESLARLLYAGGDILLMPSLYEPCGLSQMIAMRYGCVPVARAVGGLKDSIISDNMQKKDGYLFEEAESQAFSACLQQALHDYYDQDKWRAIQSRGMRKDFSWNSSAERYVGLYKQLLSSTQAAIEQV